MMGINYTDEQKEAINYKEKSLLVSASAGCGKTQVLTERIIRRICEDGVDIDKIIVLTFTKEAAGQMRDKITRAINAKIKENPFDSHLLKQEALVSSAYICTIDSFCNAVLKDYADKVGIEPSFGLIDPSFVDDFNHDIFTRLLAYLFETDDEDIKKLCQIYSPMGKDLDKLEKVVNTINKFVDSKADPEEFLKALLVSNEEIIKGTVPKEYEKFVMRYQNAILEGLSSYLDDLKALSLDYMPTSEPVYLDESKAIVNNTLSLSFENRFGTKFKLSKNVPWKNLYGDDPCNDIMKKQFGNFKTEFDKAMSLTPGSVETAMGKAKSAAEISAMLIRLVLKYREALMEKKKRLNAYTFSDIEHMVLEIMWDKSEDGEPVPSDVALFFRDTYEEIYVDEYQDSNDVQESFLSAISKQGNDGNRFMVGDVKQSIYAFRLANPDIFLNKFDDPDCHRTDLFVNFRSTDNVIDSVNKICEDVMHKDLGDIEYDAPAHLKKGRDVPNDADNITEIDLILDEDINADEGRQNEAVLVAKKIQELVKGHKKIYDSDMKDYRDVEYSDILILSATRKATLYYKEVFDTFGIPFISGEKQGFSLATEVNVLFSFLKIADNPRRDVDLFTVLSSGLFEITADDLIYLSKFKNSHELLYDAMINLSNEDLNSSGLVNDDTRGIYARIKENVVLFLNELKMFRELAFTMSAEEMLKEIIRYYSLDNFYLSTVSGSTRKANLKNLVKLSHDYAKNNDGSVHSFVTYLEEAMSLGFDQPLGKPENENAVEYMTIHGSKGLERPIVFIVGAASTKPTGGNDEKMNPICNDLGIVTRALDIENDIINENFLYDISKAYNNYNEKGEFLRLLYVALTRPRDKMIIVGSVKELNKFRWYPFVKGLRNLSFIYRFKAESFMELLYYSVCKNPGIFDEHIYDLADIENMKEQKVETDYSSLKMIDAKKHLDLYEYPHPSLDNLYVKTSVSDVKKKAYENDEEEDEKENKHYAPVKKSCIPDFAKKEKEEDAGLTGTAFHRIMELLQYDAFYDGETLKSDTGTILNKEVQKYIQKGFITREDADLVDLSKVEEFITADIGKRMAKAYNNHVLKREQPFVLGYEASKLIENIPEGETVLMQGVIDAYLEEDGELVLLDYKTDRVDEEELLKRHKLQLQIYAEALEKLTGKKVKERLIYSFNLGKVINA
jgi:ATP-dependent helicase/nuclease subunit A